MRIQSGDSVILMQEPSTVGIIERRQGNTMTIRFPAHENTDNQPSVQVPDAEELRSILRPLFAENAAEHRLLCGADLEEAVNRTYQRCLRLALGDDTWPEDYAWVNVNLTAAELTRSLRVGCKEERHEVHAVCPTHDSSYL